MTNRFFNTLIIVLVLATVSTETAIYWQDKIRPWQPDSSIGRLVFYYSFFTVLSNLLLALSCLFLVVKPNYDSRFFRVIRLDALIGVLITALVYNLVLRQIHQPPTLILKIANECLHLVIPTLGIMSWLIWGPFSRIDKKTIVWSLLPLFIYGIYIFVRGYLVGQYPYPFINILRVGYEKAFINAAMIFILFIILALLLWFMERIRIRLSHRC